MLGGEMSTSISCDAIRSIVPGSDAIPDPVTLLTTVVHSKRVRYCPDRLFFNSTDSLSGKDSLVLNPAVIC
jgi:hypothetical protein